MRIVFLDVDGELTYENYENQETADIDVEKVKLLGKITKEANAKVVISSSWRGQPTHRPKIYQKLREILEENDVPVIGDTPMLDDAHRPTEIKQWLSENDVESFVILDDDNWDWKNQGLADHWIQPTWEGDGGLKEEHVREAIKLLTQ